MKCNRNFFERAYKVFKERYGANGSGKSNLIRAMAFAQDLFVEGTRPKQGIDVTPFKLDKSCRQTPGRFEFVINYQDTIYTYGFVVDEKRCGRNGFLPSIMLRRSFFLHILTISKHIIKFKNLRYLQVGEIH